MTQRLAAVVVCLLVGSACSDSPTTPTQTVQTQTRIIRLGGNLNFGDNVIGTTRTDGVLTITNEGTAVLTVTGITVPAGGVYGASWTSGTIAPGTTQTVAIRFSPVTVGNYSGTLTVNGDQTSGTNTIPIVGTGVPVPRPTFSRTGTGDAVFDMPLDVARVRVIGIFTGSSSNFIVRIAGRLLVNELIGTFWNTTRYDGTLLTGGGGVVSITNSSGVAWSFEEIR
jgi:hypothetical protein